MAKVETQGLFVIDLSSGLVALVTAGVADVAEHKALACSENRVARLMRQHDIRARQSKRYNTTA